MAATSASLISPASRSSSSTPPRSAVTRRNMPGWRKWWPRFRGGGLSTWGVPSNDFGGQEPGTASDIVVTASHHYGVTFPLAGKTVVKGSGAHPFYKWAAAERPLETPRWNFHKYLIGRDGHIAAVFPSNTEPIDPKIIAAIAR